MKTRREDFDGPKSARIAWSCYHRQYVGEVAAIVSLFRESPIRLSEAAQGFRWL